MTQIKLGEANLDKLCADRPLSTNEIFNGNAFYGIDRVLKEYTGLPASYSLKGVWPHGLTFSKSHIWSAEADSPLPVAFCYPEFRAPVYAEKASKKVILSASPFVYAYDQVAPPPFKREGTIFFPAHSTHHVTAEMNFQGLADKLESLDDRYRPVTVCMYWKDYLMGRHAIFEDRGFPIVSAGHMFDDEFLYRLAQLLSRFQFAAGNGMGSHIMYATYAGCQYFHVEGDYELTSVNEEDYERDVVSLDSSIKEKIQSTFFRSEPRQRKQQLSAAKYFLGERYKKTPAKLRSDFLRAEMLDKVVSPRKSKDRLTDYAPFFWKRKVLSRLSKLKQKLLS